MPFYTPRSLHDLFAQYMPQWPADGRSYPTRIIGDATSAVVYFTNTVGLFGPAEIRSIGVVNFERGKIVRWVDYWDGRHFGVANLQAAKLPDDRFPADFRESTVGEKASALLRSVVSRLTGALRAGDFSTALLLRGRHRKRMNRCECAASL